MFTKSTLLQLAVSLFLYIGNTSAQNNITRVEYYVDKDPGHGNAISASFVASPNVNTSFSIVTDTFSSGLHIVGVRSRDASGTWSFDEHWMLLKPASVVALPNIDKVEWYLDTDPGYDKATPYSGLPVGQDLTNLSFPVNLSNITPGLHIVGVRSRNTEKAWSFDERWLILKQDTARIAGKIERVEWYLDTDPGYGKADSIIVTAAQDLVNLSFPVNLSNLTTGLHILGVRSSNAEKAWSFDERWLILKQDTARIASKMDRVEWYLDTDPGYGKADSIIVTPAQDLVNLSFPVNLSNITTGLHILGVRSRNAEKTWSFDERWLVLKQDTAVVRQPITYMEYYIDADPGRGNGFPLALQPGTDIANLASFVNITGLDTGLHRLGYRSRDANGSWSFDDTIHFTIKTKSATPFIIVNSIAPAEACKGGAFLLGYHATGVFSPGNQFVAELSDASGNFTNATFIGSISSNNNSGTINTNIPQNIVVGSGYKMRIRSTNPVMESQATTQYLSLDQFVLGTDTATLLVCAEDRFDLTRVYEPLGAALTWSIATPTKAPAGIYNVYATNAVGCLDTATFSVKLNVAYWTGSVSSDWHVPANWSTGIIPSDSTHVIVKNTVTRPSIISTGDASAASIQVLTGAPPVQITNQRKLMLKGVCKEMPN